ncbi:MAG: 4Fe-4S dicluster domain-containing protein [Lachnospiraceae bacterium]|nr:4Fe-4S dicluster domain-containing protein [Lachnospiraceae bacterium]
MKRQNLRKLLLIISLLLFPVTIWYMSPYLIIRGAMEGIVSGSFIVFVCMLLGSVFFGRIFCGGLCPMGGLQECLCSVNEKTPKQGWRNYIKIAIWIVWIATVILCFVFRKQEITIDFFYMTDHGISITEIYNYVIYYGVIFLVLIPAVLFGKRVFCHYFCWMAPFMIIGIKIRQVLHLPGLHVRLEEKECISCGKCNKSCPMGLNVVELGKGSHDLGTECIQCGSCVDHCPKKALSYGWKGEK